MFMAFYYNKCSLLSIEQKYTILAWRWGSWGICGKENCFIDIIYSARLNRDSTILLRRAPFAFDEAAKPALMDMTQMRRKEVKVYLV